MFSVYLAGYIQGSVLDKCIEWRRRVREYYTMKGWDICFLDPLNGKHLASITPDGLKSDIPSHAIIHRDFTSVMSSDIVVCNMDTFGEDRPLTGTIAELAWAWEHHKPIVMITDDKKFKEHPFIAYFASWVVKDVDELLEKKCVDYFFKGKNSAVY
jgi:hypothetical protein